MPKEKISNKPNVLLFMVDQMRFDAMRCAGNSHIQTPGLDRLAEEGVLYSRGYSPVPVCIPARHSMLNGHRCATHKRHGNVVPNPEPQLETLPQLLGLAGYRTQAIGKMHFRPVRRHYGFHRMELMEEIPDFRKDDEYLMYLKENGYGHIRQVHGVRNLFYHHPQTSVIPEEHHGSTWVADRTIDFLCNNRDKSFFCFSSWIAPHPPWNPPEPFASMYDPEDMPLPVGWDRDPETLPPWIRYSNFADVKDASPEMLQRIKALYYGSISLIDKGVQRILRALDELGIADDTLVIFTSDHGEMLGDKRGFQKGKPYDAASRVPFIMRFPGRIEPGQVSDELVSLLDIMPTVLDVADVEYPGCQPLPGSSLLGKEGGGLKEQREGLVVEYGKPPRRWIALLEGQWKYAYYIDSGWEELYNLEDDPDEETNLLLEEASGDSRNLADKMKAKLTEWEKKHGYPDSIEDGELKNYEVEYSPGAYLNSQFPRWVDRLPPEERAKMESVGESTVNAARKEDTFTFKDLKESGSLDRWKKSGGSLKGTPYADLLDED